MLLLIMLTSCQSAVNSEAVETVTEPVQTEETVQPAVTEAEETEDKEEVPVSVTYRYMGYNLTIDAYDGYALISYPPTASSDDVAAFLGMEAEKYQIEGVTYAFISEGELRLDYPLGVTAEERKALADTLAIDLIIYVTPKAESAPESTVTVYSYDGNELRASIGEGRTVIEYPSSVTEGEVTDFFAFEDAKHDLSGFGVVYTIDGPGKVTIEYPSKFSAEIVKAELDVLVNDLVSYITAVPQSVPVPDSTDVFITETYTYSGYELTAEIEEGQTVIYYPESISDADVTAFFALENDKYGYGDLGVVYTLEGNGKAVFTYPDSFDAETVSSELDKLVDDIIVYITPAPEAVAVSMPEPEPVVAEYTYNGYTLKAEIWEGTTTIYYPDSISNEDVEAFFALENERYGYGDMGVVYTIEEPGKAVFTYPDSLGQDTVATELDKLVGDIIEYVTPAPEAKSVSVQAPAVEAVISPVMKEYSYMGYALEVEIGEGRTTIYYPDSISNEDVEAFFALENERYGYGDMGVVYTIEEPGKAVFTYPDSLEQDTVASELDKLVEDIIAYVSTPEEEIDYPFGIEPIVKSEGDDDGFTLYIGHTNDVHGRIVESEDGSMGYSKLSSLVKMARSVTDDILLLDAGDVLHGTNLANMFEGQTVLDIMNEIGYDALAPGNHDFNYGYERLFEAAEWAEDNSTFRILSANITDENGYLLLQPYQIYDFNGFKVCVIGLTAPDTKTKSHPKNTEGIEFLSDAVIENAQSAIDVANEISDFVIVLGHIGVVPDGESGITSELICQQIDGIDLFVDGHSHTVMDGGEVVNGTLIVSTGEYLNNLGVVEVDVDAEGNADIADAFLLPATEVEDPSSGTILKSFGVTEVPSDPVIDSYIEAKEQELDRILGEVVAVIPMDLNGERADVRTKKTNLSAMICDAMTAQSGADFTIVNGGGIRASLASGPVTLGDINNVLPFTNIITVCEISPADVYLALEHGYSLLPEQNGAFAQTDLKVVYSASAPAGEKIKRVFLGDTLLDRNDTETMYKVATNDFMASGGDGYTMFGRVISEGEMLNEVFADYLSSLYPVQ